MYVIRKSIGIGMKPVLLTDGLSQILEIENIDEAQELRKALSKKNPCIHYQVIPVGLLPLVEAK